MNEDTVHQQGISRPAADEHRAGDEAVPAQRRVERRLRMLKGATIGFNGEYSGYPCVIRDMSQGGARLQFEDLVALPRHFTLHVEIDGFKVDCELVWQSATMAGVRFTGEREKTHHLRTQMLKPSESALSERFRSEEAYRAQREADHANASRQPAASGSHGRRHVAFGKRKFEG